MHDFGRPLGELIAGKSLWTGQQLVLCDVDSGFVKQTLVVVISLGEGESLTGVK